VLRVPAVATAIVAIALLLAWLFAHVGAQRKLAGLEPLVDGRAHYRITLDFEPERFHQLRLQDLGRLVEVRGNSVYMMDLSPAAVRRIAGEYWVREIARWEGR
jgi:hypothetical protein